MSSPGESSLESPLSRDGWWLHWCVCVRWFFLTQLHFELFQEQAKAIVRQPPPNSGMLSIFCYPWCLMQRLLQVRNSQLLYRRCIFVAPRSEMSNIAWYSLPIMHGRKNNYHGLNELNSDVKGSRQPQPACHGADIHSSIPVTARVSSYSIKL